jgi:hypothetical protein
MTDPREQLEASSRYGVEDPVRAAVEHEPVAVSPDEQQRDGDPLQLQCIAQLGEQPVPDLKDLGDRSPPAVVPGKGRDHARIDRAG